MRCRTLIIVLVSVLFLGEYAIGANVSRRLTTASKSVVLIRDIDGHGSGVVIDTDGLILTNYHVVSSPLPITVIADVRKGRERGPRVFDDVQVVKVHPEYDAALIRVNAEGYRFFPVRQYRSRTKAERVIREGRRCFALGNPLGGNAILEKSITAGVISAERTREDRLRYIQFSSKVNAGNSGGPLVDDAGKFIGLVTFKLGGGQGTGLAIPFDALQFDEFERIDERRRNPERADDYEALADRYYHRSKMATVESEKEELRALAFVAYRSALGDAPGRSAIIRKLGQVHFDDGAYTNAEAYFRHSLELEPASAHAYHRLGLTYNALGRVNDAYDAWLSGMVLADTQPEDATRCMIHYSQQLIDEGRAAAAAYLVRWALFLGANIERHTLVRMVAETTWPLSDEQMGYLAENSRRFSVAEFRRFAERADALAGASPCHVLDAPTAPALDRFVRHASSTNEADLSKRLPEKPSGWAIAYGGAYIVFKFPKLKRLGVFNVATCSFDRLIKLRHPQQMFAAGGTVLVIVDPVDGTVEQWELDSFSKLNSSVIAGVEGRVSGIAMGLDNPFRAVVAWSPDAHYGRRRFYYGILDLHLMRCRPIAFEHRREWEQARLRTDRMLDTVVAFDKDPKSGMALVRNVTAKLRGRDPISFRVDPDMIVDGELDGTRLYSRAGKIVDVTGGTVLSLPRSAVFPAPGGTTYVQFHHPSESIIVRDSLDHAVVAVLNTSRLESTFHKPRYVWAVPALNRVAILSADQLRVSVSTIDFSGPSDGIKLPSQMSPKPGARLTYTMAYPTGTSVTIVHGPDGVAFNAATSQLEWVVPNDWDGSTSVTVRVTKHDNAVDVRRIRLDDRMAAGIAAQSYLHRSLHEARDVADCERLVALLRASPTDTYGDLFIDSARFCLAHSRPDLAVAILETGWARCERDIWFRVGVELVDAYFTVGNIEMGRQLVTKNLCDRRHPFDELLRLGSVLIKHDPNSSATVSCMNMLKAYCAAHPLDRTARLRLNDALRIKK